MLFMYTMISNAKFYHLERGISTVKLSIFNDVSSFDAK